MNNGSNGGGRLNKVCRTPRGPRGSEDTRNSGWRMIEQDDPELREILSRASELPPKDQSSYLDRVCAAPSPRRARIDALLKSLQDRKSTRLNSSHIPLSRMPSSA